MFAITYFVMTTTCLSGAASIKGIFTNDQNGNAQDDETSKLLCESSSASHGISTAKGNMKPIGSTTTKKQATKKASAMLLRTEKKEQQQNNFYY